MSAAAGGTVGWLDCSSGCAGDMLLGALLGAGVPLDVVREAVDAVAPEAVRLSVEPVRRAGFAATRARVQVAGSTTPRTWADVRALLDAADLAATVHHRARSAFARLAQAEAQVHGIAADDVHFHEVGALDAIADVVGVCAGLDHLGLTALHASPVALGGGSVHTAHGRLAVPAPAVVALLRGVPTYGGPAEAELCTPTGAALLVEWVDAWGAQPSMTTTDVGVGAGGRDLDEHANVLRLLTGTESTESTERAEDAGGMADPHGTRNARVVECNVDDLDPRLWPEVLTALLAAGASDAWLTPILMKKGRPAHTLSVLVTTDRLPAVRRMVFTQTTSIGVRETPVDKVALERSDHVVDVDGHPVRVKVARHEGAVVNAQPEYDDVLAAAGATGEPVKSVLARAAAAARALW
jgi:pyridinium-3,5-bisthiocarboxylic acid mononucleotide nickel chelatase